MKNAERDRAVCASPEKGALTYLVITYVATLVVASATMTLLCRAISS